MSDPALLHAQARLSDLGYAVSPTGVLDRATVTALEQYQRDQGLPVTGKLDAATRARLEAPERPMLLLSPEILSASLAREPTPTAPDRVETPPHLATLRVIELPAIHHLVLQKGVESPKVLDAQNLLALSGFQPSKMGVFDLKTELAVREFQKEIKAVEDGRLGEDELIVLGSLAPDKPETQTLFLKMSAPADLSHPGSDPANLTELERGARGMQVKYCQHALRELAGYSGTLTGHFDATTEQALKSFQSARGLEVDGVVGPKTWTALLLPLQPIDRGSPEDIVEVFQRRTGALGYGPPKVNGKFGRQTREAVRTFQKDLGLAKTQVIDSGTAVALLVAQSAVATDSALESTRNDLRNSVEDTGSHDTPAPVQSVLDAAIDMLGVQEVPDGSNWSEQLAPIVEGYYSDSAVAEWGYPPWCALAVSYWLKVGLNASSYTQIPFGQRVGAVTQIQQWANAQGRMIPKTAHAPTGAIFLMSREDSGSDPSTAIKAGHTGFVIEDLGDGTVHTIEGNVSNAVRERVRPKSELVAFVKWW